MWGDCLGNNTIFANYYYKKIVVYYKNVNKIENAKELGKEVGQILKIKSNNSYKK